jgi:hypothetical protein
VSVLGDRAAQAGMALFVDWTNRLLAADEIARERFVESPFVHPSVMFRRECVQRFGGYRDGDFPEDYELWLRWLGAGVRMEKLVESLLVWNDSPTRLSRCDRRYAKEAFYRLKARYLARWLAAHNPHHPAVILWGAGRITRKRAQHLVDQGIAVEAFIDIDPLKVGRRIGGRALLSPDDRRQHRLRAAQGVHGHRRRGERRVAHRGAQQGPRHVRALLRRHVDRREGKQGRRRRSSSRRREGPRTHAGDAGLAARVIRPATWKAASWRRTPTARTSAPRTSRPATRRQRQSGPRPSSSAPTDARAAQ